MDNSRFSNLIYRIIGKPERWHDDYIDVMHQIIDETESFENPEKLSELAIGDQILSRLSDTNEALTAFGTLLDKSRFKMIILDDSFTPIYFNQNAEELHSHVLSTAEPGKLSVGVIAKAREAAEQNSSKAQAGNSSNLTAMDYRDQNGEQVYLRSIHNQTAPDAAPRTFYLMLVLDQSRNQNQLNPDFVQRHELTDTEQRVLVSLIHGNSIKEIAEQMFVSENTVKTHLKALFRKTETKSQADIIRLVLTHESQILDSYFGSGSNFVPADTEPSKDKFITLQNKRKVAYREYGPENGDVIIVCHNGYGCRVTIPRGYDEILERQNKRVIILDRPGYGRTPYIKGHPKGWNELMSEFIDALDIQSYELLGTVFGSVFALCFAEVADERLKKVSLACPVFVNKKNERQHLTGILAPTSRLVKASKRVAVEIYELWLKSIALNLSTHYRSMLEESLGDAEKEPLLSNDTIELMVEGFQEGSLQSLKGISNEMVFCISPRNIDLSAIKVPVNLWWGTQDNRISLEGVENLANQLPNAKLIVREGYSEHIYYSLFEEIISSN